MLFFAHRS